MVSTRVRPPHTFIHVPGKPLGRSKLEKDPRSAAYPFKASVVLKSADHKTHIADLDQGDIGSCTGEAPVTALGCDGLWETLTPVQQLTLDQSLALKWYENNTVVDGYRGTYPPTDTGSDGNAAGKTGVQFGYLSGWLHANTVDDALAGLMNSAIIVGVDWYEGFDNPSSSGLVSISGRIRGGHEFAIRKIDVENKLLWARNSWGPSFGVNGEFCFSFSTFETLLKNDGDATILVPAVVPAPTPIPTPVPTPTPTPVPTSQTPTAADVALWSPEVQQWANARHTGTNKKAATAVKQWAKLNWPS